MLRRDVEGHFVFVPAPLLGEGADALVYPFVAVDFVFARPARGAGRGGDGREGAVEGGGFAGCAGRGEWEGIWSVECEGAEGSRVQGRGEHNETVCALVYPGPLEWREFVGGYEACVSAVSSAERVACGGLEVALCDYHFGGVDGVCRGGDGRLPWVW